MVSSSDRKLASAVGAKTARACDSCIRKRARWYCAADDAFLCQSCDYSVHSANPLARRHERVRLKGSSLKTPPLADDFPNLESLARSWPHGFTRKARTPRHRKDSSKPKPDESTTRHPLHLVPEIFSDENSHDDNDEEQLLYRVPIFDPLGAEMCNSGHSTENIPARHQDCLIKKPHGIIIPSEIELAEFAADVESLLGKGLDEESFDMEGLGLSSNFDKVKVETGGEYCRDDDVEEVVTANNHGVTLKFDDIYDDLQVAKCEEERDDNGGVFAMDFHQQSDENGEVFATDSHHQSDDTGGVFATESHQQSDYFCSKNEKTKILLKLDYDGVINDWADQRSPWTNGERPDLDSNDWWPDFMDYGCGTSIIHPYGEMGGMRMMDEGREARVSRYREKRQKRLFSKKIRYEVRKLNAEKRPRMKGRFVKRSNFATTTPLSNFPLLTK